MNYYLYITLNFSIFIAGIIAFFKYRQIQKVYYPFIYCVWIGCLNELLSFLLSLNGYQTLVNSNIYVLLESLLLTLFFKRLGLFKNRGIYAFFICLFLLVWIAENIIFRSITVNSTYFRIFYSFILVFMSISMINKLIFTIEGPLLREPTFLLCISFVIYFTFKALIQSFVIYGVNRTSAFLLNIYVIMVYINLVCNLLHALALLWMPRKARSILPLSLPFS